MTWEPTEAPATRPVHGQAREPVDWALPEIVPAEDPPPGAPPLLVGQATGATRRKLNGFYDAVAEIFERWVKRRSSVHTRRAYRTDVMAFVSFVGIKWPSDAPQLLSCTVADVQAWCETMLADGKAPKTLNRRIASVSSFYKYLAACAAEFRLPVSIPNPAHAQFIARFPGDPVDETAALTATKARQLVAMPRDENSVLDARDRALLKVMLYTGIRISTAGRLRVKDFHPDLENPTLRINEKGARRRTIGIHVEAAEAIATYIEKAGLTSGPLFRARKAPRKDVLREPNPQEDKETGATLPPTGMSLATMYRLIQRYLERLPGAMKTTDDGQRVCMYSPHSLRATTATLLLGAKVDIKDVQELLGHRHITTTQIYDKRQRGTRESASHNMPL